MYEEDGYQTLIGTFSSYEFAERKRFTLAFETQEYEYDKMKIIKQTEL